MDKSDLLREILDNSNNRGVVAVIKFIELMVLDLYDQLESANREELVGLQAKLQAYKLLLKRFKPVHNNKF